ncbi:MAG: BatD family protein [Chitinophagales bacterium]
MKDLFRYNILWACGLLLFIGGMLSPLEAMAQLRLKAELERDSILIGEQIRLKYTALRSDKEEIEWPAFVKKIKTADGSEIEIIDQSELKIINEDGGQVREEQEFIITAFDSGYYVIPPAVFSWKKETDTSWRKEDSEALLLSVYTVDTDAESGPKALKDPLDMPFKIAEIKYQLMIAALVLLLLIAAYIWWKKRPKKEPVVPEPEPEPEIPPYQKAMQRMKLLEEKKLWQSGEIKAFYSELSEILRGYMEERYDFPALESTTDEITERLYRKDIDRQLKISVKEFLVLSDLVKFAKSMPQEDEHRQSFKVVLEFLRSTKPQEKEDNNA